MREDADVFQDATFGPAINHSDLSMHRSATEVRDMLRWRRLLRGLDPRGRTTVGEFWFAMLVFALGLFAMRLATIMAMLYSGGLQGRSEVVVLLRPLDAARQTIGCDVDDEGGLDQGHDVAQARPGEYRQGVVAALHDGASTGPRRSPA